jgi:hypothetical protein
MLKLAMEQLTDELGERVASNNRQKRIGRDGFPEGIPVSLKDLLKKLEK